MSTGQPKLKQVLNQVDNTTVPKLRSVDMQELRSFRFFTHPSAFPASTSSQRQAPPVKKLFLVDLQNYDRWNSGERREKMQRTTPLCEKDLQNKKLDNQKKRKL